MSEPKQDATQQQGSLQVDSHGNVFAEGVKICRYDPERQVLLFLDRDQHRAGRRGSNQVPVAIAALTQLGKK